MLFNECHISFKSVSRRKLHKVSKILSKASVRNKGCIIGNACMHAGHIKTARAAHSSCNLNYKIPKYIPVVFQNLAGYDSHLFIRELAKYTTGMGVIAKNTEDYNSFSIKVEVDKYVDEDGNKRTRKKKLRFIDSTKFMSSSLDSLVNNLARGGHQFWEFESYNRRQRKNIGATHGQNQCNI